MEIPIKVRKELDKLHEAPDNSDYVISSASGIYIPKKGDVFVIRHYHHIDGNRRNNELWNLAPLNYQEHIIEIGTKVNKQVMKNIYEYMCNIFPEHEEHYRKHLLKD